MVWSHLRALLPVKMVSNIKGKVPHQAISIVLPLLYDCAWSVTGENLACYIHMHVMVFAYTIIITSIYNINFDHFPL